MVQKKKNQKGRLSAVRSNELLYRPSLGDPVIDGEGTTGKIISIENIHNVLVDYDNGGSGYYCLSRKCKRYSPLRVI